MFNVGIILVVCLSEGFIFQRLYRTHQISKLNNIVEKFHNTKKDTYVLAEQLAYDNEVCISVVNNNYVAYNFNTLQVGCILGKNNEKIINSTNNIYYIFRYLFSACFIF